MGDSDNEDGGDLHATTDDVEATVRLKLNEHDEGRGNDVDGDVHVNVGEDEGESESQSGASSSVGGGKRRKKKRKKKSRKEKKEKKKAKKEKRKKRISDETADDEDEDQHYHQQQVDEESEEQQQQRPDGSSEDVDVGSEEIKKRCDILANLPSEITDRFLEVGFGKWDKQWLPVLELGPFDVKGGVHDQWMHHYELNLEKEMGRVMPRLVYWYGVPKERSNEAFSFLAPNSVVAYEEGVERGLNKLSAKVQKKVNKNGKLTKPEKDLILGLQQIEIDHALAKDDRMAWMKDEPSPPPPLKRTKKKKGSAQSAGGKSERAKVGDVGPGDNTEEDDSAKKYQDPTPAESEEDAGRKKKKRKQTPKSEKGKRQKTDEAVPPPEGSSQLSAEPLRSEEGADHSMSMDRELSDDEEKINEEPEEEEGYRAEEEDGEDEDEEEEEFEPERKGTKRKRLSKGKPTKKKVAKAKAGVEEDDGMTEEKRKARDKKRERDRLYRAKQREQRMFEENEEIFLPEMRKLEVAVEENDAKAAMKCLLRLQSLIPKITPSFIEGHGIGLLVKRTRTSFESDKAIKSKCKGITNAMKVIYNDKKKNVPDGFVPKKSTTGGSASEQQPKEEKSVDVKKSKKESSTGKQAEKPDPASAEIPKDTLMDAPIPVKERAHEQGRQPSEALDVTTSRIEGTSQPESKATSSKAAPATELSAKPSQPARKAFSLKTMLHGPKPAVASKSPGVPPDRTASSVTNVSQRGQRQRKILPAWLTEVSDEDPPTDDMRKFAIELLETTEECFPTDTINPRAFVRNVEAAVYALSRKESVANFTGYYWDKITEIVGAIKGKFVTGAIAKEIADGNFPTAKDLASLESAKFFDSFEGL